MSIVVLGLGNALLSDEGVGVHVLQALESRFIFPDNVALIDGGTCGMELLEQLENLDALIIIDCVRHGLEPGTPVLLTGPAVPVFFKTKLSPHQIGLADVLASLTLIGRAPAATTIVGIQPESLALGTELSPVVASRVTELITMTLDQLAILDVIPEERF